MKKLLRTAILGIFTFAFLEAKAECLPGTKMIFQKHPTRVAVGREAKPYSPGLKRFALSKIPDFADTQVYIYVVSWSTGLEGPAVPEDWCYDTDTNEIRLVPEPRFTPLFSSQRLPIGAGDDAWVGYFSSQDFNADCTPGAWLNYLPGGPDGGTYGQFYFNYDTSQPEVPLRTPATPDHQIYLYTAGMWIYGYDWCFSQSEQKIRFLRNPPRIYSLGAIPSGDIGDGNIVWVGYVPVN